MWQLLHKLLLKTKLYEILFGIQEDFKIKLLDYQKIKINVNIKFCLPLQQDQTNSVFKFRLANNIVTASANTGYNKSSNKLIKSNSI